MAITAEQFQQRFPQLVKGFQSDEIQILLDALARLDVSPGEELVREGDPADAFYLVWEGGLSLVKEFGGKKFTVGTLGPGRYYGDEAVIDPAPELVTLRATEPSILLRLDHANLEALGETHSRLADNILRVLALDMVGWLRCFEEYMTQRTLPNDVEECIGMIRRLMGFEES